MLGQGLGSGAIGELSVLVVPDTSGFGKAVESGIQAQSGTGAAVTGKANDYGKKIGTAMAGGAAAAFGKGIVDFTQFERGLNEVFTLIPDAGQETFDQLTRQTKEFAAEFGVLPQEVIQPLYDSLSAGVPADNVFTFLEAANTFSKAGAVDLATSVDALTTGVNAFGLGAEGAGRVSDSLFTAVKLGKTTVDELSASLFQVAPVAASFGLTIEDVSAGFATLTAQGVPTAQAATQMKAAIAELGKEGTKAQKVFEEFSGKSLTEFLAEGNDFADVVAVMERAAEESGLSIVDLFGSIEAGSAFLGLSGENFDKFASNLDAVNASAGATEVAFEQMEKGIGPALDKIKARLSVAFLNLGETLAPSVEAFGIALAGVVQVISDLPGPLAATVVGAVGFGGALLALSGPITRTIGLIKGIGTAVGALTKLLAANPYILLIAATIALGIVIFKNWDKIKAFIGRTLDRIGEFFDKFIAGAEKVWDGFADTMSDIMDSVAGAFRAGWDFVKGIFDGVASFIRNWWRVLIVIFLGPLGVLINQVTRHWDSIKAITETVFGAIADFFSDIWARITETFELARAVIEPIVTFWFDAMKAQIELVMSGIQLAIDFAWAYITGVFQTARDVIGGIVGEFTGVIDGIGVAIDFAAGVWDSAWNAMSGVVEAVKNTIVGAVEDIKEAVSSALGPLDRLAGAAGRFGGGAADVFGDILGFDTGGVVPGPMGAPRLILAHGGETVLPTHKQSAASLLGARSAPSGAFGQARVERTVNINLNGPVSIRSDDDIVRLRREFYEAERREAFANGEVDVA